MMLIAARNAMMAGGGEPYWSGAVIEYTTVAANETVSLYCARSKSINVDWGDGTKSTHWAGTGNISHTYASAGVYTAKFDDAITSYGQAYVNTRVNTIIHIRKFGDTPATVPQYGFRGFVNLLPPAEGETFAGITQILESAFASTTPTTVGDMPNVTTLQSTFGSNVTSIGIIPNLASVWQLGSASLVTLGTSRYPGITSLSYYTGFLSNASNLITPIDLPNLTYANPGNFYTDNGMFRQCYKMPSLRCPKLGSICQRFAWNCYRLKTLKLGEITEFVSGNYNGWFEYIGLSLTADTNGVKSYVWVKNTMDSIKAVTGFPAAAPTSTRFVCRDGYIQYASGAWTNYAWTSVSSLPEEGDEAYLFDVNGTTYQWNGTEYVEYNA